MRSVFYFCHLFNGVFIRLTICTKYDLIDLIHNDRVEKKYGESLNSSLCRIMSCVYMCDFFFVIVVVDGK